jgi:hypothetical protein
MEQYRLLFVEQSGAGGGDALEFECSTDREAINMALDRAEGRAFEVWAGERRILCSSSTDGHPRRLSAVTALLASRPRTYTNW